MNYPFDTVGLAAAEIDRFYDIYTALKAHFDIQCTGDIDFKLEQFEVFRDYFEVNLRDSFVIKHQDNAGYILFVDNHYKTAGKTAIYDHYEYQVWALAFLKHDFGRVLIRRETLADKIIELVHPIELDFKEDMPFSDTFYVLVNDREKAIAGIDRHFRNAVMDIREDDFVIEIVEHTLIIGSKNPATVEKAGFLAEFLARLCTTCN